MCLCIYKKCPRPWIIVRVFYSVDSVDEWSPSVPSSAKSSNGLYLLVYNHTTPCNYSVSFLRDNFNCFFLNFLMIITLLIFVTGYKFKITIMNDKKPPKIKKKFWLKICNKNLKLFCSWWVQSAPSSFCGRCPSPEGPPAACCSGPVSDFLCLSRLQFPTDRKNERRQCIPFFTLTFSFYHWLFVWFSV